MKKFILINIFVAISFCTMAQSNEKKMPTVDLKSMDGSIFSSSKIENSGKPIVIIVWETYCRPCLNYFDNINEDLSDWKKETGVKIVVISIDDSRSSSKVAPMVKSKGWDFESYLDTNREFKSAMGISACPYTFLMDGTGKVLWEKQGYSNGMETELFELIKKVAKGEKIK